MPQITPWFTVRAEADSRVVRISVRGVIGEWGVTDYDLIREIEAAGEIDEIHVEINSRGGEVDHALGIYNYLASHDALVSVRVTGIAASAGSIIAMAGDTITMPANALMMVHSPWSLAIGNADELRKAAEDLDKFSSTLVETYKARTGKSEDEIKALLEGETWLTAAEAKELGFADVVDAIKTRSAVAMAAAIQVPEDVMAKIDAIESAQSGEPGESGDPAGDAGDAGGEDPAPAARSLVDSIRAEAKSAGLSDHAEAFLLDSKITSEDEARAAMSEAQDVVALCEAVGSKDKAAGLIRDRKSLAEARAALIESRVSGDPDDIDKTINSPSPRQNESGAIWDRVLNLTK